MEEKNEAAKSPDNVKAISLLSGGLDSILATRVVQDQGVDVLALNFITPFFGADKKGREEEIAEFYRDTFGIKVRIVDVSEEYLRVLADPKYGYGKNFNPCIDCKIFLIRKAIEVMHDEGAKFLITGEVLGQRPMSQRRDTMNAISRDTGTREYLLRPLSAKLMTPTKAEEEGYVDREKLYDFSGRSRKPQMALAEELGIGDYPTPAGGCRLTDPCLAERARKYFVETEPDKRDVDDFHILFAGRPFRFPGGSFFTLGRNRGENKAIAAMARPGDEFAKVVGVPGPLGLFRPHGDDDERALAGSVLLRYCPKAGEEASVVFGEDMEKLGREVRASRPSEEDLESWRV